MCERCGRIRQNSEVESDKGKLFAVVNGDKATYCLTMVSTSQGYADQICMNTSGYRVQEFDCADKPKVAPYPVYVVSVGDGDHYRIVNLSVNKKHAHKLASSIQGVVSVHVAIASTPEATDARFYKWFIPLGPCNQDEDYYYTDYFRRRVLTYDNQDPPPTITRRRRYDDGLPYRLEIADTNQDRCGEIAKKIYQGLDGGGLSPDTMEYNVEYTLVFNTQQHKWEIDPCLL